MAKDTYTDEDLYQSFLDAGCSEDTSRYCITLVHNSEWSRLCSELAKQKTLLLSVLHEKEKQIDCLDYLVYEIKKHNIGGKKYV